MYHISYYILGSISGFPFYSIGLIKALCLICNILINSFNSDFIYYIVISDRIISYLFATFSGFSDLHLIIYFFTKIFVGIAFDLYTYLKRTKSLWSRIILRTQMSFHWFHTTTVMFTCIWILPKFCMIFQM